MLVGGGATSKQSLEMYLNDLYTIINNDPAFSIEKWEYPNPNSYKIIDEVAHPLIKKIIKKLQEHYNIEEKESELREIEQNIHERRSKLALSERLITAFSGMPFILLKQQITPEEFNNADKIFQDFIEKYYNHHERHHSANLGYTPERYMLKQPVKYITNMTEPNMTQYINDVIAAINKYNTNTEGGRKNRQKRRTTTKKGRSTKRRTTTKKRR